MVEIATPSMLPNYLKVATVDGQDAFVAGVQSAAPAPA